MLTPESENRWGQNHQEPPDGVLWYERERGVRCARLTRRNAFFNRRGLPLSLESFLAYVKRLREAGFLLNHKPKRKRAPWPRRYGKARVNSRPKPT